MAIRFEIVCNEKREFKNIEIKMPLRATADSIAYDMYSNEDMVLEVGKKHLFWTDIKILFPKDVAALINVRSSMGIKNDLVLANTQGWIESDYYGNIKNDGNIGICLKNDGNENVEIKQGDAIGQVMFVNYLVAENCNSNNTRQGGIGSTDKK